jgi:hypothetical protein
MQGAVFIGDSSASAELERPSASRMTAAPIGSTRRSSARSRKKLRPHPARPDTDVSVMMAIRRAVGQASKNFAELERVR